MFVPALLTVALAAPVPKEKTDALKALAGEWVVTREEAFGKASELYIGDVLAFDGDSLTHTAGETPLKYTVQVTPKAEPPRMDWRPASKDKEKEKGISHRGIYKLDGDRLTVCVTSRFVADDDDDRPTEFRTQASRIKGGAAGEVLLVLERKKK